MKIAVVKLMVRVDTRPFMINVFTMKFIRSKLQCKLCKGPYCMPTFTLAERYKPIGSVSWHFVDPGVDSVTYSYIIVITRSI